jgi:RNA polymerase sigma-70 factor (ECF subfamily)
LEEQFLKTGLHEKNKVVFDFVFQYYYSGLCAFAESLVKDEKVVEDIVQDLFVKLWIKSDNIQITGSVKSYLFSSVKNRCFDYLKHQKVKLRSAKNLSLQGYSNNETPENWLVESELKEIIEKSLEKLPPRCVQIFKLSRFDGLKNQEIADQLNLSKRTVELQISNALKVLRTDLKPFLPAFLIFFLLS